MNIKDYDYNKHDKLVIVIKKALKKQILSAYSFFKWEEVQSKRFLHLKMFEQVVLIRPHNIPNKDRVQYLQVCFERQLDKLSKSYTFKNLKSILLGLFLCVFSFLSILFGVILMVENYLALGGVIIALAVVSLFCFSVFIAKIRRKENKAFNYKSQTILQQSEKVLQEAKELLEVDL